MGRGYAPVVDTRAQARNTDIPVAKTLNTRGVFKPEIHAARYQNAGQGTFLRVFRADVASRLKLISLICTHPFHRKGE